MGCAILLFQLLSSHPKRLFAWIKSDCIHDYCFSSFYGSIFNTRIYIFKPSLARLLLFLLFIHKVVKFKSKVHCFFNYCFTCLQWVAFFCFDSFLQPLITTKFNLMLFEVIQCSFHNLCDNLFITLSFLELCCWDVNAKLCWICFSSLLQYSLSIFVSF